MGHIISPLVVEAVNVHDSRLLPESVAALTQLAQQTGIDLFGSFLTLDPGFDSAKNKRTIAAAGMIPVIKPNLRGTKNPMLIAARISEFADIQPLYRQRHAIERAYAWEDKYRKLVIRYERLRETFLGWRYLAASLTNLREGMGKNLL